jgi:beta-mannosidase
MFGWDWGPTLPDVGIWRDIKIECFDNRINDFYITQVHSDGKVVLDIDVDATSDDVSVEITSPDGEKYTSQGLKSSITITNPMLWWHTGYGEQNLYDVKISLGTEDSREFRIGLRTLTINTEKDEWGSKFCFNINGKNIFAKGSNYIPEDNILSRMSEERTRKLLTDCVKANHNSIRIWGGGTYPPDYFYDICDELGIIVWQDFMFACGVYSFDEMEEEVTEEVIYNVKRLRHHSCIGLWCGNNELSRVFDKVYLSESRYAEEIYIKQ